MERNYSLRHCSSRKKQNIKNRQQDQRQKTLKEVLNRAEKVQSEIAEMLSRLDEVEDNLSMRLNSLTDRVAQVENKMTNVKDLSQSTRDQLDGVNIEMEQLKNKVAVQEKLVSILQDSLDDIQGRMRWNTVVIRGIPENRKEEGSWSECKKLVAKLLREHLHMPSAVDIERAHRSPTALHPERKTPRPIFVAFLRWKTANEVISKSPSSLKKKPWRDEVTNSAIPIFVEQMFSPNVSKLRQQALKKRRELKDENPSWTVFLSYPAKLFYKQNEEDRPQEYVWTPGPS